MTALKFARLESGKTQKQMAEVAHITQVSYQVYEKGTRIPPVDVAISIADFLDVDVKELWGKRTVDKTSRKVTSLKKKKEEHK